MLRRLAPRSVRSSPARKAEHAALSTLFDKRLVIVIGKGGVGKTTVSAALALAAAQQGQRVLLAMCHCKEGLSELLQVTPIGAQNQPILPNIDAVNIEPQAAMREYATMILKVPRLVNAVFGNRLVAAFLQGAPGLAAWSMLGKTYYHATADRDAAGRRRYDLVILDAPATGHGLEMLHVPRVIEQIAPPGPLRKDAELALQLLQDAQRTAVLLVTLAEEMPVSETLELYGMLRRRLQLPVSQLVVNRIVPTLFDEANSRRLAALRAELPASSSKHSSLTLLLAAAERRQQREAQQAASLQRLAALPLPQSRWPHMPGGVSTRSELEQLGTFF